ncbi:MAG: NlpC/P60 family protein [Actinomycetota bacterium]
MTRRAGLALAVSGLLLAPGVPALSAAESDNPEEEIDRLATQISSLDEDHNEARVQLSDVEQQISQLAADQKEALDELARLRQTTSDRAAAAYRLGMPDMVLLLFGSDSITDFQRRLGVASRVGSWESSVMARLNIANQQAEETARELDAERNRAQALADSIAERRSELKARSAELQRAVARQAQRRTPQQTEAVAAEAAPRDPPTLQNGSIKDMLSVAYAQMGKPYSWGASGPGSFDCSGFTSYAYRSIGVSLPHSSRAQYATTKRVSRDQLKAGDLVFFGSPIHHVGIYVGNGNMIDSSTYGRPVGVRSINRSGYAGAGRVVG